MTRQGRLCGLIDWEHAGFRPEFWEYTRAVWTYSGATKFARMYSFAFDKGYGEELEGEIKG
jgi:hypothetical protein